MSKPEHKVSDEKYVNNDYIIGDQVFKDSHLMISEKKSWKGKKMRELEKTIQSMWHEKSTDIIRINEFKQTNKYFATFPYPYMNGYLHIGHAFTLSKYDFICRYYRMIGYKVLQPFSFHLTGMPIMAAVDKLKEDLMTNSDSPKTQYNIMKKMNISDEDMVKFTDPHYWGKFFPASAANTLKKFGIGYDETRSFITTEDNPYYDKFIKWQFSILQEKNVLRTGTRFEIFSIKESQPCLGHERSSGEDAKPLKSYIVPYKIINPMFKDFKKIDNEVWILASTSRPETLYGATNLWINNNIYYSIWYIKTNKKTVYWITQDYVISSLQYQKRDCDEFYIQDSRFIQKIIGKDLCGQKVCDIMKQNQQLPILALNCYQKINKYLQIDMNLSSCVAISVPCDSPIDYVGYIYAQNDDLINTQIIPCVRVEHDTYQGNKLAIDLIDQIKTINANGTFNINLIDMQRIIQFCSQGVNTCSSMCTGEYKDKSIIEARNSLIIKMEANHEIITYYEPDQQAFSRSGEKLIVSKMDQWFIDYGNKQWKNDANHHLDQMHNNHQVMYTLKQTIQWLDQWPCSRRYGLGSRFPPGTADPEHMIDSLSDSTIYMALYTIYHYFKELHIDDSELNNEIFNYIFLLKDYDNQIFDKYKPLREEFIFWYPFDLRVSAKDLLTNHLAMSIFHHVIVWDDAFIERLKIHYPEKNANFGPVLYEINGYITVKGPENNQIEKMSKSNGNFKTLDEAIDTFSADALRFTLASSSNGIDDALFDQDLASKIIEKIYKEKEWILNILEQLNNNIYCRTELMYCDNIFNNEMNILIKETIKAYQDLNFQCVITKGFHLMQLSRDHYVEMSKSVNLHPMILRKFIDMQLFIMYPIIPHFCEYFKQMDLYKKVMTPNQNDCYIFNESIHFDKIKYIDNLKISMILHWTNKYTSEIAGEISKKVRDFSKKIKITKIIVITTQGTTDKIEQLVHQIIQKGMPQEKNEIINIGSQINPSLMKDNKLLGLLIKHYRRVCELINVFGDTWYQMTISGELNEKDVLTQNLKYHMKYNPSDKYTIEITSYPAPHPQCDEHSDIYKKINGIKLNEPLIYCM